MKEAEAILLFWLRKNNSSACHHMRSCWKTFPFSEKTFPLYYSNCSIGDYHQKMMQFFKGKGKCMMKLIGLDSPQQRDRTQRALLRYQNFDFLFYLGWSGSFPQTKKKKMKVVQCKLLICKSIKTGFALKRVAHFTGWV